MAAIQAYQFVPCSGNSGRDKAQSLTSVKKHVMNDYFRKRGKRSVRHVGRSKQSKPMKADTESEPSPEPRHPCKPNALDQANSTPALEDLVAMVSRRSVLLGDCIPETPCLMETQEANSDCSKIGRSPGLSQSDPFDSLPVKHIPNGLVEWFPCLYTGYDKGQDSWVHRCNLVWAQNLWHSAVQDVGLFYTVLSQAERNRMVMTCSADNTRYLFLRGQALQALRKQISTTPNNTSDALILLVAYQIRFAIVEGDFPTARTHVQAASVLIEQCQKTGEVSHFVMVHATLMDVKLAVASCTRPVLGPPALHPQPQISLRLTELVRGRSQVSLSHLPFDFRDSMAEEAMTEMHWHVCRFDSNHAKEVDGGLPVLMNCARTVRHARHIRVLAADAWEEEERRDNGKHLGSSGSSSIRPRTAFIHCLEFFGWMHDPAHLIPWISHSVFMKRLANNLRKRLGRCLDLESNSLEDDWQDSGASQESLLWVLMIGFVMTVNIESETDGFADLLPLPYLDAIDRVMLRLQILDQSQLEQALKVFPWTDNFCGTWSKAISARLGLPLSIQNEY